MKEQVDILNNLASLYAPINFDSSIFYSAKAMRIATINSYTYGIGCSRLYTGNSYYYKMDFKNAMVSYLSAQTIFEEGAHYDELGELFMMMGHINFFIVRTSKAVAYYYKAMENYLASGNNRNIPEVLYALSLTYWRDGPVDSSMAFEVAKKINSTLLQAMVLNGLSAINIKEGKFEAARENLDQCEAILQYCEQYPEQEPISPVNYSFGKIFNFFLVLRTKADMFESRFSLAMAAGNYMDAVVYQELYFEAMDTLKAEQQGKQLELLMTESEAERTDQKIKVLAQENELNRLKVNQNRLIFAGIAAIVVIISFILLFYFQRKRLKAEQKSILNEQRLLRAQMNPHFLFNSLASIQNYIINEDTDRASIYLSRFSQLVRNILDNSTEEYVSLEKEIEVPPMLAQPFIENAIEHGIRHKETKGHIDIRFIMEDGLIRFVVEDDGVGREKAREIETKHGARHRSMATSITLDRLATLNKKLKKKIRMEIVDLKDETGEGCGTRVAFGIPVVVR